MNRRRVRPTSRPWLEALESRSLLAAFTVTSIADSGVGTLRQAILDADAASAPSRIVFNIPSHTVPSGDYRDEIDLVSPLPVVAGGITIDGTTQPGYTSAPVVAIVGSKEIPPPGFNNTSEGLVLAGNDDAALGLLIGGCAGDQLLLTGSNDVVQGDDLRFIDGIVGRTGLSLLGSSNDLIGGTVGTVTNGTPVGDVNVMVEQFGIFIGPGSNGNVFENNTVDYNSHFGLYLLGAANNTIGGTAANTANDFSGNGFAGVVIADPAAPGQSKAANNQLVGNYISKNGASSLGAVAILSSSGNTVSFNDIVENNGDGLLIGADPYVANPATASGNVVVHNLIGDFNPNPEFQQQTPPGNIGNGVVLGVGSANNSIGGTASTPALDNSINYNGGDFIDNYGTGNVTAGNFVAHYDERLVNIGIFAAVAAPLVSPYPAGASVTVDFTATNYGPGYASDVYLIVDFSESPAIQALPLPNDQFSYIAPGKVMIDFGTLSGSRSMFMSFVGLKDGAGTIGVTVMSRETIDRVTSDKTTFVPLTFT